MTDTDKTMRNKRVQARYDELMREGKHGHYETMFRVVCEEVEAAIRACAAECARIALSVWDNGEEGAHGGEQANRTAKAIRERFGVE